jgi:hypothetical protein
MMDHVRPHDFAKNDALPIASGSANVLRSSAWPVIFSRKARLETPQMRLSRRNIVMQMPE